MKKCAKTYVKKPNMRTNARKCARKIPGRTKNERRWGTFRYVRSVGVLPEDTTRNIQNYVGTK